jgi:hypothetical protein
MHSPLLVVAVWITFTAVVSAIQARTGRTRHHEDARTEHDTDLAEPPEARTAA